MESFNFYKVASFYLIIIITYLSCEKYKKSLIYNFDFS